jgi:hypothetical protein
MRRRPQGPRYTRFGLGCVAGVSASAAGRCRHLLPSLMSPTVCELTPKQAPISRGKLALSIECPVGPADEPQQGADRCAERTDRPQQKANGVGAQQP